MGEVNREVRCTGTKNNVKMEPIYFEWDRFILTLEAHFPDILEEILNCGHQRNYHKQGQGQSIPAGSSKLNINFRYGHIDRV